MRYTNRGEARPEETRTTGEPLDKGEKGKILAWLGPAGDNHLTRHIRPVDVVPIYRAQGGIHPAFWEILYSASAQADFSVFLLVLDERRHPVSAANPCH